MKKRIYQTIILIFACIFIVVVNIGYADPPIRVARLSYFSGEISFSPAGENEWIEAILNRPLTIGDRLWSDNDARAELQLGSTKIRMGSETSIKILNLNDRTTQIKLEQGILALHIAKIKSEQFYEINTPNIAFSIHHQGDYRIDVDFNNKSTLVSVRKGQGIVYGEGASYIIDAKRSCLFLGTDLRRYKCFTTEKLDNFDRWNSERNLLSQKSISARYVSDELIGYEDLDTYGTWKDIPNYGYVWYPTNVSPNWVPYRYGHWLWIEPWGWTWIEDEPWGFAPFHYGRWVYFEGTWYWVPGRREYEPIYAPALVVFIVDLSRYVRGADIGWFPLGPGDIYIPPYSVGQNYFININIRNTVINPIYVNNFFNNPNHPVRYHHQNNQHAITAVPKSTFVDSKKIDQTAVPVSKEIVTELPIKPTATITPTQESKIGTDAVKSKKPRDEVLTSSAVTRTIPSSETKTPEKIKPEIAPEEHSAAQARRMEEHQKAAEKQTAIESRKVEEKQQKAAEQATQAQRAEAQQRAAEAQRAEAQQRAAEQQGRAEAQQKAAEQQATEARKAEVQQRAAEQQAAEARRAEAQQKAAEQQAAEARRAEAQQKAAEQQATEARKAEVQQSAAEQQAAEARRAEAQQKAAEQQATEARKAEVQQRAAEQQAAEARRAEAQQRAAEEAAEARRAEAQQRAAEEAAEARRAEAQQRAAEEAAEARRAEAQQRAAEQVAEARRAEAQQRERVAEQQAAEARKAEAQQRAAEQAAAAQARQAAEAQRAAEQQAAEARRAEAQQRAAEHAAQANQRAEEQAAAEARKANKK